MEFIYKFVPLTVKKKEATLFRRNPQGLLIIGANHKGASRMSDAAITMDIAKILQILPHRYPFLLVDRVLECVPGSHIRAYKNITINEPFFQGHFPGAPIVPGVLILEALAQTGGLLAASGLSGNLENKLFLFTGLDHVKFRRQVVPGDRLDLECGNMRMKLRMCKLDARATVDGKLAAEAQISAAIADRA